MIDVYRGRFHIRDEAGRLRGTAPNARLYSWGWVAARLFMGDPSFRVAVMYVEYRNLAGPSTPIANPTFQRQDGLEYYDGLAASPDTDYLRVLCSAPAVGVIAGYESYFQPGQGNLLLYKATTGGTTGVHGKPFSAAANSKVYGAALAAAPFIQDSSQDVLVARGYYPQGQHLAKQATGQLEITYEFPFE